MSRDIIDSEDGYPFSVNTFWMGDREGVQITWINPEKGFCQLERDKAIELFKQLFFLLREQKKKDTSSSPWWQELSAQKVQNKRDNK